MRKPLFTSAFVLLTMILFGAEQKPQPDIRNLKYGQAERNVMDIWLAKSAQPAPLVIFVHGGGFVAGDKSAINGATLNEFLKNGITVAAINYRYRTGEPDGVMACLSDVKYALQYLRYNAAKYNIDKSRVAMMGSSAGAGSSLWIAFHDDMADPQATDPVLRESTRIQAAVAISPQATYDLLQWPALYGMEESSPYLAKDDNALNLYGIKSLDELDTPAGKQKRAELDMLGMMTPDDPPFMAVSDKTAEIPPISRGQFLHHPIHVKALREKAERVGVECVAIAPAYGYTSSVTVTGFIIEKLNR